MSTSFNPTVPSANGEPTWEATELLPIQGQWTESDFFNFHTNRMAELANGRLEVLPKPTWLHQLMVKYLVNAIEEHIGVDGGIVLFAPLPVRLFSGTVREPDVLYVAPEHFPDDPTGYPSELDFVIEVVSSGEEARRRDYHDKRSDYAHAKIKEYWIVDPELRTITVLGLKGTEYEVLGTYSEAENAVSQYLVGFSINVTALMALANRKPKR